MSQGQALEAVNGTARAGDWVVAAAGSPPGDLLKLWHAPAGSHAHIEFGFSCMGHEIPAGIGIRMADPDAGEVIVIVGDGTFLMAPTELVTAVQERVKITVVVLVNGGYQSIHALQRTVLGGGFGTEFRDRETGRTVAVDYAATARSLGCATWEADTPADIAAALGEARAQDRPAVVACRVEPYRMLPGSGAWWDLGVPETSERGRRHRAGAQRQRYLG